MKTALTDKQNELYNALPKHFYVKTSQVGKVHTRTLKNGLGAEIRTFPREDFRRLDSLVGKRVFHAHKVSGCVTLYTKQG